MKMTFQERYWQQEEQKEERDYPHRPQFCGLFFSFQERLDVE